MKKYICNTYEYKKVDDCSIYLDIYESIDSNVKNSKVLVWIHGGGFIFGSRKDINESMVEFFCKKGYVIVSIDYRLAPKTKLPSIIEDIEDALIWIKDNISLYKSVEVLNVSDLNVIGASAGGYLALMTGTFADKPKSIVSLYGYGDILSDWALKASSYYLNDIHVSQTQAEGVIDDSVISESEKDRYLYYLYARQSSNWIKDISGYNTLIQKGRLKKICPLYMIKSDYPSTLLIHGDSDEDVELNESIKMYKEITRFDIRCELEIKNNHKHDFDKKLTDTELSELYLLIQVFIES